MSSVTGSSRPGFQKGVMFSKNTEPLMTMSTGIPSRKSALRLAFHKNHSSNAAGIANRSNPTFLGPPSALARSPSPPPRT